MTRSFQIRWVLFFFLLPACQKEARPVFGPEPETLQLTSGFTGEKKEESERQKPEAGLELSGEQRLAAFGEQYIQLISTLFPEEATGLGLHDFDTELDAYELGPYEEGTKKLQDFLSRLEAYFDDLHLKSLTRSSQIDFRVLRSMLKVEIEARKTIRPLERKPSAYTSVMNSIFWIGAREYAPKEFRAKNMLARIEKIPAVLELAKLNLSHPPKVWTEIGIQEAKSSRSFFEVQKSFLISALPSENSKIDKIVHAAVSAFERYASFLERKILPLSDGEFACGKRLFDVFLKEQYFLKESAQEIKAIGQHVFVETENELKKLAQEIDPNATSWIKLIAQLKRHHPPERELLQAYRFEVDRAKSFLVSKKVVPMPDPDDLELSYTPEFMRSTILAAYDPPPPFDKVNKGFFFVTPPEKSWSREKQKKWLLEHNHGDIVNTTVHEAYPGHHLQLAFSRAYPSVIRRISNAAIFSEGWALYSEELMHELKYDTKEERMFQLQWTLVRAARVLLDVGLHTEGMPLGEAESWLENKVGLESSLARSEVKRYSISPGQPLSYLIGRQKIFELREEYMKKKGEAYSLLDFHRELLSKGTIAPSLMAEEILTNVQP